MPLRFARPARPARWAALVLVVLLALGATVAALGGAGPDDGARPVTDAGDLLTEAKREMLPFAGSDSARAVSGGGAASPSRAPAEAAGPGSVPASPPVGPVGLGGPPLPGAVATGDARVVKTAVLTLGIGKGRLDDVYQQALDAATRAGGWVQASETGRDQATLVLKVPANRLEGVLAGLRDLGKVRSESIAGEDVSQEYVDLEARLTHWQAQEAVFLGLMAKAKTISETIQIQQQLSVIQEQIEQLEGRRRYLEGQTSFSTVRLSLLEAGAVAKEPETSASTLARAWERAMGVALDVIGGTLVVLGAVVPLALVLGIPALGLAALRRRPDRSGAPVAPAA